MPTSTSKDTYACMNRLEQRMKQMKVLNGAITWDDFSKAPMANLPTKFRMPKIERYTGLGYPHIHLRIYNTIMRAHGLDKA